MSTFSAVSDSRVILSKVLEGVDHIMLVKGKFNTIRYTRFVLY